MRMHASFGADMRLCDLRHLHSVPTNPGPPMEYRMIATVVAVARDDMHSFSKPIVPEIDLIAGRGVVGDAHAGQLVRHRSRVKVDPTQPNLRQVHLMQSELFETLAAQGFTVAPGDLGENITTKDIDLLGLSRGCRLAIGPSAVVEITGLRNPCHQIEAFQTGLLRAVLGKGADGTVIRKTGVMGIVRAGGKVSGGDRITVHAQDGPHAPLQPV